MWPISLRKDYREEHLPAIATLHLSGKEGAGQGDGVRIFVPRIPLAKPLKVAHTLLSARLRANSACAKYPANHEKAAVVQPRHEHP